MFLSGVEHPLWIKSYLLRALRFGQTVTKIERLSARKHKTTCIAAKITFADLAFVRRNYGSQTIRPHNYSFCYKNLEWRGEKSDERKNSVSNRKIIGVDSRQFASRNTL